MKQLKINWSYICYKEFKIKENKDLKEFLKKKNIENFVNSFEENFVFVLWGDWTMFEAIKEHYNENLPFFWINFWSKWFLLNQKEFVKQRAKYEIQEYSILKIKTKNKKELAVNEFDFRSKNGRMAKLNIEIWKKQKFSIEWDWIIVSTKIGSTWYNNSLWWPILLDDNNFVITPKASWNPRKFPSIVINNDEIIKISNSWRQNEIDIFWDGKRIFKKEGFNKFELIIKKAKRKIKIVVVRDYLDIWSNKFII